MPVFSQVPPTREPGECPPNGLAPNPSTVGCSEMRGVGRIVLGSGKLNPNFLRSSEGTRNVRWHQAGVWDQIIDALAVAHNAAVQMIDNVCRACTSTDPVSQAVKSNIWTVLEADLPARFTPS